MKQQIVKHLCAIALFSSTICCVSSRAATEQEASENAKIHNIEYSKLLQKSLFPRTQNTAMSRTVECPEFVDGFLLKANADKIYKSSQPIKVEITFINLGAKTLVSRINSEDGAFTGYQYLVYSPDGKLVAMNAFGTKTLDPFSNTDFMFHRNFALFTLHSRIVETVQLNRYFDMTQKGRYKIVISRNVTWARPDPANDRPANRFNQHDRKPLFVFAEPITITVE